MRKYFNKKFEIIIILIFLIFILCGCWDEKIFEKTGFITIMAIDYLDGSLKVTYGIPATDPETKEKAEIIETKASLLREAREKVRMKASKNYEGGTLQVILISREIAEKGIISLVNDVFERDTSNPALAWEVIVDGNADDWLKKMENLPDKPRTSIYLESLLERNVKAGYIPETKIYSYDIINCAQGIDNIAPLIKVNNKHIEVKGSALFSNEKMVGIIDTKSTGLLLAMKGKLKNKNFEYISQGLANDPEGPKGGIANLISEKKRKIDVDIIDNIPVVNIKIDLYGSIEEYKTDDLQNSNKLEKISNSVKMQIQKDCVSLIKYMQSVESDPIGIGDIIRAKHNKYFISRDWNETYKSAKINVEVNYFINHYGTIS